MRTGSHTVLAAVLLAALLLVQAGSVSHRHAEPLEPRAKCLAAVPTGDHCHLDRPREARPPCPLCLLASHWLMDRPLATALLRTASEAFASPETSAGARTAFPSAGRCRSPPASRC